MADKVTFTATPGATCRYVKRRRSDAYAWNRTINDGAGGYEPAVKANYAQYVFTAVADFMGYVTVEFDGADADGTIVDVLGFQGAGATPVAPADPGGDLGMGGKTYVFSRGQLLYPAASSEQPITTTLRGSDPAPTTVRYYADNGRPGVGWTATYGTNPVETRTILSVGVDDTDADYFTVASGFETPTEGGQPITFTPPTIGDVRATTYNVPTAAEIAAQVGETVNTGGTGSGDTAIDHDGGSGVTVDGEASATDVMRFTLPGGGGADGVEVVAYLKADYDAGLRATANRQGTTSTGSDGRWVAPLMLDAGTYTILGSRGGYVVASVTVDVPEVP